MLTLKKAITLLQMDIDAPGSADIQDLNEAEKLGIEALKRVKHVRETYQKTSYVLLPGETEEK